MTLLPIVTHTHAHAQNIGSRRKSEACSPTELYKYVELHK